ncbi:hypothetical protein [Nocardia sp. CA-135398]|uniref:hypothetical protein n=1 Tax=Nocardia sp. CA-135398 TaxID=3239977 RepID=UPI003D998A3A
MFRREERDITKIGAVLLEHPGKPLSRWDIRRESGLGRIRITALLHRMASWEWLEDVAEDIDGVPRRDRLYMLNTRGRTNLTTLSPQPPDGARGNRMPLAARCEHV